MAVIKEGTLKTPTTKKTLSLEQESQQTLPIHLNGHTSKDYLQTKKLVMFTCLKVKFKPLVDCDNQKQAFLFSVDYFKETDSEGKEAVHSAIQRLQRDPDRDVRFFCWC